jgi:hypothetical protein
MGRLVTTGVFETPREGLDPLIRCHYPVGFGNPTSLIRMFEGSSTLPYGTNAVFYGCRGYAVNVFQIGSIPIHSTNFINRRKYIMKLATIALAAALGLAQISIPSCSSGVNIQDIISGVQFACQFVPTADTVETLLKANNTITTVTQAVSAICQSVQTAAPTAGDAQIDTTNKQVAVLVTNGKNVPIVGHFVTK